MKVTIQTRRLVTPQSVVAACLAFCFVCLIDTVYVKKSPLSFTELEKESCEVHYENLLQSIYL